MHHTYTAYNFAMPTTAAPAAVTTGTAIKTMLQIATPSTRQIWPIAWGYTLDAVPASGTAVIELIQTDVAATVTAHAASGVQPKDPNGPASLMTLGTTATGFTATAEGTTTASRTISTRRVPSTAGASDLSYEYQFLPWEIETIAVSRFLRVRVTFAAAVNMTTWVTWDE